MEIKMGERIKDKETNTFRRERNWGESIDPSEGLG